MPKYQDYLKAAATVHDNAQTKVRGPTSTKRIDAAVAAISQQFDALDAVLAKINSGTPNPFDTMLLPVLREIESQRAVLQSAVARAQAEDEATVKGVVVNQAGSQKLANDQKAADDAFLAKVNELLDVVREDLSHPNTGG
jgi:hypothetical protein